ncbi:MAG: hypothetical protein NC402_04735 [Prevotella sp.]|nr:hypothetical protein [Prevotella sp.]MCM1074974.1 hypothetical protein [Ruminococcus sp.]
MIKPLLTLILVAAASLSAFADGAKEFYRVFKPFDKTVFYDGYNENVFDKDVNDGITRHANYLYAKPLTDAALNWFGEQVDLDVTINPLCDNYDRIGNISIALVPKGETTYDPYKVQRIELARFITPFMNKNKYPDSVNYHYDASLISMIMRDSDLRAKYDLWLEYELFGIPYAANTQITGCKDRNDVFAGTLTFTCYDDPAPALNDHILVPIVMKKPEFKGHNMNNYSELGTDTIGTTTKTYRFTVPEGGVSDSNITLIMSNHGANENGEEYNPRTHLLYFDGELIATWKGGRNCEPYRYVNTQANGIYDTYAKTEQYWIRYSNWCPGADIPTRVFGLGELPAGEHEIMIRVPEAVFADKQGDFPVSMYFQGLKTGTLPVGIEEVIDEAEAPQIVRNGDVIALRGNAVSEIAIYTYDGKMLYGTHTSNPEVSLVGFAPGIYLVNFTLADGSSVLYKAAK